jgi:hypothetical protein
VTNPFLKKNPWMSMWLSGANAVLSASRAQWESAARQNQAAMTREAGKAVTEFWSDALTPPSSRKRTKRDRR